MLHSNLLSGSIPPGLGASPNLTNLRLDDNALAGSIPTDARKPHHTSTPSSWTYNRLSGTIPTPLGALSKLTASS